VLEQYGIHLPMGPVDPAAQLLVDQANGDSIWQGLTGRPAAETRALYAELVPAGDPPSPREPIDHIEDLLVPGAKARVPATLYRPSPNVSAVIVWAHGGGFTLGSVAQCDAFTRALALATGCAVLSIEYRLAPEHPFPAAIHDVEAATVWVITESRRLFGRLLPILLGGDSAGGNLATVVTRRLNERAAGTIAAQILAYPCVDTEESECLRRFEPPYLTLKQLSWLYDQYLPDSAARRQPDFAPITAANLEVMPQTIILTAEHDILTEQGQRYGRQLVQAGVPVEEHCYHGMIHGFLTKEVLFDSAAGQAIADIAAFVGSVKAQ
jgi:acetyl esterase